MGRCTFNQKFQQEFIWALPVKNDSTRCGFCFCELSVAKGRQASIGHAKDHCASKLSKLKKTIRPSDYKAAGKRPG